MYHPFCFPSRLILPYERFIKGEEDKPLPPIKPRKQENNSPENENKTKVSGTKRIKHELPKNKKEKENTPKPQDTSEVSCYVSQRYKTWETHSASGASRPPESPPRSLYISWLLWEVTNSKLWAGKRVRWVALAAQPDGMSLLLRTHIVKGEHNSGKLSTGLHTCT